MCLCHYGLEHYKTPLACVRSYYHQLVDIGVDCVVGAHPHIAQGYEYYKDKLIVYSLGNFFFPRKSGIFEAENHSYSVLLNFEKGKKIHLSPVFHMLEDGMVKLDQSCVIELTQLNTLIGDEYPVYEKNTLIDAYNKIVSDLLYSSLCSMSDPRSTFWDNIKNLLRYTLFRSKYVHHTDALRSATTKRLLNNEIYRYILTKSL